MSISLTGQALKSFDALTPESDFVVHRPVYMTLYFVPAVFLRTKSFIKA